MNLNSTCDHRKSRTKLQEAENRKRYQSWEGLSRWCAIIRDGLTAITLRSTGIARRVRIPVGETKAAIHKYSPAVIGAYCIYRLLWVKPYRSYDGLFCSRVVLFSRPKYTCHLLICQIISGVQKVSSPQPNTAKYSEIHPT